MGRIQERSRAMDVNLINPFIESFTETLPQIGFQSVIRTNLAVVNNILRFSGVLVNISLIGQYKGASLIGMDITSAKSFASKMMMGMPVAEFDELAQSAVSEMGNMVCAGACSRFSTIGIKGLDISPPTLLMVTDGVAKLPVPQAIAISYVADDIPINMYVGITAQ